MPECFLNTSTVLKRYVQETGTPWVQALAAPTAGHSLIIVRITLAETVAAIPVERPQPTFVLLPGSETLRLSEVDAALQEEERIATLQRLRRPVWRGTAGTAG